MSVPKSFTFGASLLSKENANEDEEGQEDSINEDGELSYLLKRRDESERLRRISILTQSRGGDMSLAAFGSNLLNSSVPSSDVPLHASAGPQTNNNSTPVIVSEKFRRILFTEQDLDLTPDGVYTAGRLLRAFQLREKYVWKPPKVESVPETPTRAQWTAPDNDVAPATDRYYFKLIDGVYSAFDKESTKETGEDDDNETVPIWQAPSVSEYYRDLNELAEIIADPPTKSFAYRRLELFQARFRLHALLNGSEEKTLQKVVPHRDLYNVRKVDTHIHHSAAMNQKHLLRFIKKKLRTEPDEVVIHRDGKDLTLKQVFESLNLTAYHLSVDTLDVHADNTTFHRFDKFNLKYNPCGQSRLREVFLKTSNKIKGRYLAEITKELFDDLSMAKYQFAEYRLSVYGRTPVDWTKLAAWVCDHELYHENVRWMIQIPRLWSAFKESNTPNLPTFQTLLDNIFRPLFAVTIDPSVDPKLHRFLKQVVSFDCVDDESTPEHKFMKRFSVPADWTSMRNPPYSYWAYYIQANLRSLNVLRARRGFSLFSFRPHAGEAGDRDHLLAAYLTANAINHGIELRKLPTLQYLFYLSQIGLAMSPLSNNALFVDYHKNPFHKFFERGLNVSLSTDDPLQFHFTREPLMEEYSVAAQVWKLSSVDLMEVARNSVLQSDFEPHFKRWWIGPYEHLPSARGNDIHKTNIPNLRVQYRAEQLVGEFRYLRRLLKMAEDSAELDMSLIDHIANTNIDYVSDEIRLGDIANLETAMLQSQSAPPPME